MQYRRLGNAGVKVSEIGLGGWLTFGNSVAADAGRAIIKEAFANGINFFDTANVYATGKCEEMWGELLAPYPRSSHVLATKVFFPMGDGPNDRGLSRKHIFEQCHASLRRLKTEYIDLYQCHRADPDTPLEETISTMNDLVRQGKILYWGFSMWTPMQIQRCVQICGEDHLEAPRGSQPKYNLIERSIEREVMPLCHAEGIGQIVFCPLAQGLLTGKYKPGDAPPTGSRGADERQNSFMRRELGDDALLARIQRLQPLAEQAGCTMAQLSLAWILTHPAVSSCITGATRPEQVRDNAKASGIALDKKLIRAVEDIFAAP